MLRRPIAIPAAIIVLAAPYVAGLGFEIDGLDTRAPLIAALLLAVAELAYWSLELRGTLSDEPGTYLRRVALLAGLTVGTIAARNGRARARRAGGRRRHGGRHRRERSQPSARSR